MFLVHSNFITSQILLNVKQQIKHSYVQAFEKFILSKYNKKLHIDINVLRFTFHFKVSCTFLQLFTIT